MLYNKEENSPIVWLEELVKTFEEADRVERKTVYPNEDACIVTVTDALLREITAGLREAIIELKSIGAYKNKLCPECGSNHIYEISNCFGCANCGKEWEKEKNNGDGKE